jgi:hypothetical protein
LGSSDRGSAMESANIIEYLGAAKLVVDLFKAVRSELPKGSRSTQIAAQIERAEQALRASEAKLAKELGYKLCDCTFPPQIMLWHERKQIRICPNRKCGRKLGPPAPLVRRRVIRLQP